MADFSLLLAESAMDPPPDAAADTSERRQRALLDEHFDFVWRLLRRLGVPEADADDAAQRVFMVGVRRLADIPVGSERTFLYGTTLRVAATTRRDTRRRKRWIETSPADGPTTARSPHEELERRQALAFLDQVLQQLGDELREVFVLSEIEGLTAPQVSELLDIPTGTVASRLRRARRDFSQHVERLRDQKLRAP
jgi:RNA polymerase sigma-70 factor (ECF subfamily)